MSNTDFSKLRVGIVGAGLMGRWHAKYARRLGVQLAAILDHDITLATQLARETGRAAAYSDVETMLTGAQLDVIHICTPLDSHFSICKRALDAGIHVIVEKPLAATAAETETLLAAASEQNVKLCPVHQFGFQNGVFDSIAALASLGELYHLRFTVASAGGEGRTADELNEIIADVIPHPLSILQRLQPDIDLDTRSWSGVNSRAGELHLIGDTDGIDIDISISMNARPTRCEMILFCSKGTIKLNLFHGYAIIETGNVSRMQKMMQPMRSSLIEFFVAGGNLVKRGMNRETAYPGLKQLLDEFYTAVANNNEPPIPSADMLAVARARDDIVERFLDKVVS